MQLHNLTIRETHELLISKQISSVELTQATLQRAHEIDPQIRSYVTITDDLALEQAKQADERIAKNENITPLTWMPPRRRLIRLGRVPSPRDYAF